MSVLLSALAASAMAQSTPAPARDYASRAPEDEVIYFLLPDRFENGDPTNDRGGIAGGRLDHGFDPTNNGFYQGGDLKGLTNRLDYIQGLGASAIWLSPIFKNKPVQGVPGAESAGYHGYWITDFLDIDPHLGTREDFKEFVDAAHARGIKVYMDIITNHTADVIKYQECHGDKAPDKHRAPGACPYRSLADFPYSTQGSAKGEAINPGFLGDDAPHRSDENFAQLTDPRFAYTPYIPPAETQIKNPVWLNDPIYYHNRGDSIWEGESVITGDFAGLDDLMTSNPRVVDGFIEIYKQWITDFRVDGFRIDTAKHVHTSFWQKFTPEILAHAKAEGIENFHIFGEVYEFDPAHLAKFTTAANIPTVLDFAFQGAVQNIVAKGEPTREIERLFGADVIYAEGFNTARQLPTFLGNHDMGRFSMFIKEARPGISDKRLKERTILGHALMMFSRGAPTLYYGDEQGFVSDGNDRGARETMFPGKTPDYLDNDLIAAKASVADDNFDTEHPIYQAIAELAAIRHAEPGLRRGAQLMRYSEKDGGAMAFSRFSPDGRTELVAGFNADDKSRTISFPVDGRAVRWESLYGQCRNEGGARGVYTIKIPARAAVLCKAELD